MKNLKYLLILLFFGLQFKTIAQIDHDGAPYNFSKKSSSNSFETPFIQLEKVDLSDIDNNKNSKKSLIVGKNIFVNYTPENSGVWEYVSNGQVWRLGFHSSNAEEIGLFLTNFELENGVKLYVYPEDKSYFIGAFTSANNKKSKKFPIRGVKGDRIVIEMFVPDYASAPEFTISEVHHYFSSLIEKKSGSCHVNINCPEGDEWQTTKRAVVKYTYSNGSLRPSCTGTLINNTKFDGKPYILTAQHCIEDQEIAETVVAYFGYESATCESLLGDASMTIGGANYISGHPQEKLDFALLELTQTPPNSYNPYYAGWNRNEEITTSETVSIHHPGGLIKKISKDYDSPRGDINHPFDKDDPYASWAVSWDLGVTLGGSSGGPLFDSNHRIIGDLVGGTASCTNPELTEFYTKLHLAWNKYPEKNTSLWHWLDPIGSEVMFLDGLDPINPVEKIELNEIVYPKGVIEPTSYLTPKIVVYNPNSTAIKSAEIKTYLDESLIAIQTETFDLAPLSVKLITLDKMLDVPEGKLRIEVSNPNDQSGYVSCKRSKVEYGRGTEVNLEFPSIESSNLIAWKLTDTYGKVLYEKLSNTKLTVDTYPFVLTKGCYKLEVSPIKYEAGQEVSLVNLSDNENLANSFIDNNKKVWDTDNTKSFCLEGKTYKITGSLSNKEVLIAMEHEIADKIELINIDGRIVNTWEEITNEFKISLEDQRTGSYIIRLTFSSFQATEPIVFIQP